MALARDDKSLTQPPATFEYSEVGHPDVSILMANILEAVEDAPRGTIPEELLKDYARVVAARALVREETASVYLEVPLLPGVWADGPTEDAALAELQEVIFEWALLKIQDGDQDFPVVGEIDLNVVARAHAAAANND